MYCNQCGKMIPEGSQYCNFCGHKQDLTIYAQTASANYSDSVSLSFEESPEKKPSRMGIAMLVAFVVFAVVASSFYFAKTPAVPEPTPIVEPTATVIQNPVPVTNGQILIRPGYECVCPFSVSVPKDRAYYIFLEYIGKPSYSVEDRQKKTYLSNSTDDFAFYVSPGSTINLNVPIGVYKLYCASGNTWLGTSKLFGEDTAYSSSDEFLVFYADTQSYNGLTLDLLEQVGGNFSTAEIPAAEFPR